MAINMLRTLFTQRENKGRKQKISVHVLQEGIYPNPKRWQYTESERKKAMRLLLLGNSGRAVGRALGIDLLHNSNSSIKVSQTAD